jgi:L-fuculose-phosphate aldolase
MIEDYLVSQLKEISLSMFRKNFFGIFHGAISARVESNRFIINKKDAIFDGIKSSDLIELYFTKDYQWNEASLDAGIHLNIYKNIPEAKYICYAMPPFTTAYSITHDLIIPKDYFGAIHFGNVEIYNPRQFEDWYERAEVEIYRYMKEKKTNIMVIKGYGVYAYGRDIHEIAKNIALLDNSCRLLHRANEHEMGKHH